MIEKGKSSFSRTELTHFIVSVVSCRQNDTTEDVVLHVMQPTVSSTRMVVGDIISGNVINWDDQSICNQYVLDTEESKTWCNVLRILYI